MKKFILAYNINTIDGNAQNHGIVGIFNTYEAANDYAIKNNIRPINADIAEIFWEQ